MDHLLICDLIEKGPTNQTVINVLVDWKLFWCSDVSSNTKSSKCITHKAIQKISNATFQFQVATFLPLYHAEHLLSYEGHTMQANINSESK